MKVPIRALRYGESGCGKTELIRTWPINTEDGEWVFVFDFDGGLNTLRNVATGELPTGIYAHTFRDREPRIGADDKKLQRKAAAFQDARSMLTSLMAGDGPTIFEADIKAKPTVVVIDTLTGLHDAAMNLALTLDPKTGLGGAPAMHHWGAQMRYVEEFVRMCESEDWHLDVTAHVQAWKDDVIGTSRGTILVTGQKSPGLIPGWFDEVYYHTTRLKADGTRYIIKTKNDGYFVAKSRLGVPQDEVDVTIPDSVLRGGTSQELYGWSSIFAMLEATYGT